MAGKDDKQPDAAAKQPEQPQKPQLQGDTPARDGAQAQVAEKHGEGGGAEIAFTAEQQAKIDQIIAERLKRQSEKLKAEADEARQQAERQAEEARLAEQQKFQELADKRKAQIDAIEPQLEGIQEQLERYRVALEEYVKSAASEVPDFVRPLLEKMDPVDQLHYLSEHADAFTAKNGGAEGPPKTPKKRGEGELSDEERKARAWHVRQGGF